MRIGSSTVGVAVAVLALSGIGASPALAKKETKTWEASRTVDPITGASTCVVAAYDRFGTNLSRGISYTRIGILYPIVENNSRLGLLVGVSSGGQVRLPAGDVVWRVDSKPFRELKAADNPDPNGRAVPEASPPDPSARAMQDATALAMRLAQGAVATSTVASGDRAKEMLREMREGSSLIYRAAYAAPTYGLPSAATYRVGQVTEKGPRPIPLDASFGKALAECGID